MRVGIIGAGHIAGKMANTINALSDFSNYAIASRTLEKAEQFKNDYHFEKAYGSYEELIKDPNVDLVYIATPNSCHYDEMELCLKYHKPVLCEKPFTTSLKDTINIYSKFEKEGVYIAEALWTSFMPSREIINNLIYEDKVIGEVTYMESFFTMPIMFKERVSKRELGGGAVMDLGVYPISFILRTLGFDYLNVSIEKLEKQNDVDVYEEINFDYPNGVKAKAISSVITDGGSGVTIYGTQGKMVLEQGANCPWKIDVFDNDNNLINTYDVKPEITGYEYELIESKIALEQGKIEPESWTHQNSITMAKIMEKIIN